MASRERSSWRGTWGNVDGTSRPARGLQGTSGRRPMERVGLRAGVRAARWGPFLGRSALCFCCWTPCPAWAGHRFEDVMEWGWHVGWTGPRRGWLQGRRVGPSPPGPRPLPTPALAVDLRLAKLASPRAVQGSVPEAGPEARGATKCTFSKLGTCGPANRNLLGLPALHETLGQEGHATGHSAAPAAPSPGQDPPDESWSWWVPVISCLPTPPHQGKP